MEIKRMYYSAEEIAVLLGVSVSHSYKIIRELNNELKKEGFIVISGKLPIKFFEQKYFVLNS